MQPREGRDRARATRDPWPHPGWSPARGCHPNVARTREEPAAGVAPGAGSANLLEPFDSPPSDDRSTRFDLCYREPPMPASYGLYDPRHEHDACGLGALVQLDGTTSHRLVAQAVEVLRNLDHRGATGSDPETGDGAGILTQLPDAFLRRACAERRHRAAAARRLRRRHDLPAAGPAGAPALRGAVRPDHRGGGAPRPGLARRAGADARRIGELARASAPVIRQLLVERREGDAEAFERKLYVIRRRVEKAAAAPRRRRGGLHVHEPVVAHAGLQGPAARAAARRPSTPTSPSPTSRPRSRSCTRASPPTRSAPGTSRTRSTSWRTTARSTPCAATPTGFARASRSCARELFGGDLQKLFPIADERWSDSATLDAMLELLVRGGRSLAHARGDADPAGLERPDARPAGRGAGVLRVPRDRSWSRGTGRPR